MKKFIIFAVFVVCSLFAKAQQKIEITESDYTNQDVEMADQFRADGKIYVLTGIICLIFGGIVIYLFTIDRKVSKLEKLLPNNDD